MEKISYSVLLFLFFMCCPYVAAQKTGMQSSTMNHGESVLYDIYFKWGPLMPRAGDATFLYDRNELVAGASSRYHMHFKTAKFFDGFFKMRDTLSTFYDTDRKILYSVKKADEGNYYSVDKLTFRYGKENTKIHSLRYTPTKVKIDTTLMVTGEVTDILGAVYYLRGVNREKLQSGDTFPLTVAIGRDLVKMQFIYENQSIVDRGNVKYNTRYFKIDIYDEAFESTKTSAEVWMGDDDNFLPVKVRSKLKIGYAEVYYKSSSNLAHPLKCRIEIKK